jgi:threonine dehydrogenase-like Zn-dependent dehydrogenase
MKAIRFHGNQDIRYEEVPVAKVGADQVKIAPEWCGLCGSGSSIMARLTEICTSISRDRIIHQLALIRLPRKIFRGHLAMNLRGRCWKLDRM